MPFLANQFTDGDFTVTDIDRRYRSREVPMRVLALGLCRTGTLSLTTALKTLGYSHAYHGVDAAFTNPRDCELWLEALRAKYDGKGTPWGRKEFDQLLGHCQAVSDVLAVAFTEDLIRAYPEAKVILTIRDEDEWFKSASLAFKPADHPLVTFFFDLLDKITFSPARFVRPAFGKAWDTFWEGNFQANGRRRFREHYKLVQELVPPENLLCYHVKQGWAPLCEFLGEPLPSTPMPHENELKATQAMLEKAVLYYLWAYIKGIFSMVSGGSFALLTLSVLCGDSILGPKLRATVAAWVGLLGSRMTGLW